MARNTNNDLLMGMDVTTATRGPGVVQHVTTRRLGRERNVLFKDALNTFYLRLYGVRHMVKDHSDSEKGNPLPPHRLILSINRQDNTYHGLCYTSRGALAGTKNSSHVDQVLFN